jgi:hypothetical protein
MEEGPVALDQELQVALGEVMLSRPLAQTASN